jgi:hypothetical protein
MKVSEKTGTETTEDIKRRCKNENKNFEREG